MKKFLTTAFGIICIIGVTGYLVNLKNQKDNEFKEQAEKEDQRVKRLRVNVGNVQSPESEENGELDGDELNVDEGGGGNWSAKTDEDWEATFKRQDAPRYSDEKRGDNRMIICPNCNGSKKVDETCNRYDCSYDINGNKKKSGGYNQNGSSCSYCHGSGIEKSECDVCHGKGRIREYE
ncbi:MAG: hypothetical protein IT256_06255 [Chitinophagaceae bacterium]|nr:hypothetical protein [Chitinophagaceae bacterium]